MVISAGTRLGPYLIQAPIGAGGMGEVYRARDTRLGRDVAVKVLPQHVSPSPEDRARLRREAKAISSLGHPHICALYDIGCEAETDFLVMELIEGETLAQRLARGAIPTSDVLRLGAQIADALHRAHRAGVVHRDIKPGNVMLTRDGAKLMDFGLARWEASPMRESEGMTATCEASGDPITSEGTVVGTFAYMAPEQLEGKPPDFRSDIWALGCVLYEMATAKRAFQGRSQASLIAAIMSLEPAPTDPLAPLPPTGLERLLRACLAKDPEERIQSAHDVGVELTWIGESASYERWNSPPRLSWPARVAALLLVLAVSMGGFWLGHRIATRRFSHPVALHSILPLPEGTFLAGWSSPVLALSSDGKTLAYVATAEDNIKRLYVHRLDQDQTLLVPGSEEAEGPMFSPSGEEVAFAVGVSGGGHRSGELLKYSMGSGLTQSLCKLGDYFGGEWLRDGTILLVEQFSGGLWKVSAEGGPLMPACRRFLVDGKEEERRFMWPQVLPDRRHVLGISQGHVVVVDLTSRKLTDTGIHASFARYAPTGHLVYAAYDSTLLAAPFDAARGVPTGPGVGLMRGVSFTCNGAAALAFSATGTLAYAVGPVRGSGMDPSNVVRINLRGEIRPLPIKPVPTSQMAIAPDGHRMLVSSGRELWIYDLARDTRLKLPEYDVGDRLYATWLPDGGTVAFSGHQEGWPNIDLFLQSADGRSGPTRVGGTPFEDQIGSVTPDGQRILFGTFDGQVDGRSAVWEIPLGSKEQQPRQVTSGLQHDRFPRVSPDGHLLAYEGTESDREVYLNTYPDLGAPVQVSMHGGDLPRWSADGRELLFRSGGKLYSAAVQLRPQLRVGIPRLLFDLPGITNFDVLPDGTGLIGLQAIPDTGKQRQLHLVANWYDELERVASMHE